MLASMKPAAFLVPPEYRPLHKYLDGRYADTVVLTFAEIEDLLGIPLPDAARSELAWWSSGEPGGAPPAQSHAWMQANRTAKPNLRAEIVVFERTSV
jgi:hypothetical protein